MLRSPLQELCLQLRLAPLLTEHDLRSAFALALDQPPEAAVTAAISSLQRTGALDVHEQLTPAQAALHWNICEGISVIPGADNLDQIIENCATMQKLHLP